MKDIPRQTEREQIENMPSSVLFDLARNESARWEARKAATALLVDRADSRTKHAELAVLVQQIAHEVIGGTQSIPEQRKFDWPPEQPPPSPPVDRGAPSAGFTTKNMFQEEVPPLEPLGPAPVATGDATNDTFKFRSSAVPRDRCPIT